MCATYIYVIKILFEKKYFRTNLFSCQKLLINIVQTYVYITNSCSFSFTVCFKFQTTTTSILYFFVNKVKVIILVKVS